MKKILKKEMVINSFIGITSLPDEKKKLARLDADRCFTREKIHLPKSKLKYTSFLKYIYCDQLLFLAMTNHRALGKALVCVSKAIIKNVRFIHIVALNILKMVFNSFLKDCHLAPLE